MDVNEFATNLLKSLKIFNIFAINTWRLGYYVSLPSFNIEPDDPDCVEVTVTKSKEKGSSKSDGSETGNTGKASSDEPELIDLDDGTDEVQVCEVGSTLNIDESANKNKTENVEPIKVDEKADNDSKSESPKSGDKKFESKKEKSKDDPDADLDYDDDVLDFELAESEFPETETSCETEEATKKANISDDTSEITKIEESTTKIEEPTTKIEEPTTNIEEPTTKIEEPTTKIEEPTTKIVGPKTKIVGPTTNIEEPATDIVEPVTDIVEPTTDISEPEAEEPIDPLLVPLSRMITHHWYEKSLASSVQRTVVDKDGKSRKAPNFIMRWFMSKLLQLLNRAKVSMNKPCVLPWMELKVIS